MSVTFGGGRSTPPNALLRYVLSTAEGGGRWEEGVWRRVRFLTDIEGEKAWEGNIEEVRARNEGQGAKRRVGGC